MSLRISSALVIFALAACGDDAKTTSDTSTTTTTQPDTSGSDTTVQPDGTTTSDDTAVADDSSAPDDTTAGVDSSTPDDTGVADTSIPNDTIEPTPIAAVSGARCALDQRVALVEIDGSFGQLSVNGNVYDRPSPFIGEPEIADDSCSYYRFVPAAPCPTSCPEDEVCGIAGTCVPAQLPVAASLKLGDGVSEQTFTSDAESGGLYGSPTFAGRTISADLTFGHVRVTAAALAIPASLGDATGTLQGDSMSPEHLTIVWRAPTAIIPQPRVDSFVYSLIPINHHAGGPTFTECQVGAATGQLDVEGAMLEPLAVITGLEFQGIDHVRFAAADTAEGCVEFRWLVQEFPNITEVPATR